MKKMKKADLAEMHLVDPQLIVKIINNPIPENIEDDLLRAGQFYNHPGENFLKLLWINDVIGGYGVEGFTRYDENVEYVNAGDTYNTTICLLNNKEFVVSSWGDELERIEREYEADHPCEFEGTVSSGTMRTEDLIEAFESFLDAMGVNYEKETEWKDDDDQQWYLMEVLWDLMEEQAPAGWYFGAHPGDGSDFGYWRVEND